mmetsp:Transcript_41448/g.97178  ORF Transcript_41448/g.97178 Transcript_41448/m.97178 type:complete len:206 (+) Transcript_41448:657-1274(+)
MAWCVKDGVGHSLVQRECGWGVVVGPLLHLSHLAEGVCPGGSHRTRRTVSSVLVRFGGGIAEVAGAGSFLRDATRLGHSELAVHVLDLTLRLLPPSLHVNQHVFEPLLSSSDRVLKARCCDGVLPRKPCCLILLSRTYCLQLLSGICNGLVSFLEALRERCNLRLEGLAACASGPRARRSPGGLGQQPLGVLLELRRVHLAYELA